MALPEIEKGYWCHMSPGNMKKALLQVALVCLILTACARPGTSPGSDNHLQEERIQRVENGLIPLTAEDAIEWRNPTSLA